MSSLVSRSSKLRLHYLDAARSSTRLESRSGGNSKPIRTKKRREAHKVSAILDESFDLSVGGRVKNGQNLVNVVFGRFQDELSVT